MNPLVLVLVLVVAVMAGGLVLLGLTRRRKEGAAEEMVERMGRFATREEFLTVADSAGNKHEPSKVARSLEEMVKGGSMAERVGSLLARADVKMTVGEFLLIRFLGAAGGFGLGFVILARLAPALGVLLGIAMGLVGYVAPFTYFSLRARRRVKTFVRQLGDTITMMANSLRAGYSLLQTMEMVSREVEDPMGGEFRRVVREVGLGISSQEAMGNLLRRVPSDDLDLLVTAINIQHEVGGNLAQILTIIGHTIRERVRIKGEIAVLTAQQSISGYVITALPIALALLVYLINPDYILGIFVWPYVFMPIVSSFMLVLGFFAMRKITAIEV